MISQIAYTSILGFPLIVILGITASASIFLFINKENLLSPPSLEDLLRKENISKEVLDNFLSLPAAALEEKDDIFTVKDNIEGGIKIEYPNRQASSSLFKEKSENSDFLINFPKNAKEAMEIVLDKTRSVFITDHSEGDFESRLLKTKPRDNNRKVTENKFLEYRSKDERKSLLYAYQKDIATGERKLKNWIIYQTPPSNPLQPSLSQREENNRLLPFEKGEAGRGSVFSESESYEFTNALLKKNLDGSVGVYYYDETQELSSGAPELSSEGANVDNSLMARAQRVLSRDFAEDKFNHSEPDITIPAPYYLDKDGNRVDVEWTVSETDAHGLGTDGHGTLIDETNNTERKFPSREGCPTGAGCVGGGADEPTPNPLLRQDYGGQTNPLPVRGEGAGDSPLKRGAPEGRGVFGRFLSLSFSVSESEYPIALDPTLEFTAPGAPSTGDVIDGETSSQFGTNLAIGDLNNDGRDDLVVGAPAYNLNIGRVYIFYNSDYSSTAISADMVITGEGYGSFGNKLLIADLNDDGKKDLISSAWQYSTTGRVYIFHSDGQYPALASQADKIITGEPSGNFGSALLGGDFNQDGKEDLVVSDISFNSTKGKIYLFYNDGSYDNLASNSDANIVCTASSRRMGHSLAKADINLDGKEDLIAGTNRSGAGSVFVFYNDLSWPANQTLADITVAQASGGQFFGKSLATGDFNADGKMDLAVGDASYNLALQRGAVFIFYNNNGTLPTSGDSANKVINGVYLDGFGGNLNSGDFNNDGRIDLAAYGFYSGRTYLIYNDGDYPVLSTSSDVMISVGGVIANGDLNSDGKTDLVVGDNFFSSNAGRVYIFYSQNGQVNLNRSVVGMNTTEKFGTTMLGADLNNDSLDDLVVGATGWNSNAGRTYIFFNQGSIALKATSTDTADVKIDGEASNNYFGRSFATGDFDRDGDKDLAVGADGYSTNKGRVYLFYSPTTATSAVSASWKIDGEANNNYFGYSIAADNVIDVNASGTVDLVAGAYGYNSSTGRLYIISNDGSFPVGAGSADEIINSINGLGNKFGYNVITSDFSGDGKTDIAVGWPNNNAGSPNYGAVYFYNNDGDYPTNHNGCSGYLYSNLEGGDTYFGNMVKAINFESPNKTDVIVGSVRNKIYYIGQTFLNAYLNFGFCIGFTPDKTFNGENNGSIYSSAVTGDFNIDGKIDFAVSTDYYSASTGKAYIFLNTGTFPTTATSADIMITGSSTNDYFGSALAAGDWNSDGKIDLAVGAYGVNSNKGAVYLYETRDAYAWQITPQTGVRTGLDYGQELHIDGEAASSKFGSAVSIADFNSDGKNDLAVGASGWSTNTGRVYLFYNDGSYPRTAGPSADAIITGETTNNYFGGAIKAEDLNSDGKKDLIISARGNSSNIGKVYVFYNTPSYPALASSANLSVVGEATNNYFGDAIEVGDFNADGTYDLAVGAYGYSSSKGRAYLLYNDLTIPTTASTADIKIDGEANGDLFSNYLLAIDANRDGRTDLAVSAPYYDGSSATDGRVYIFNNDGSYATLASAADVKITGELNDDGRFGTGLGKGDLNNDGWPDLLATASLWDYTNNYGKFYGIFMDTSIPTNATNSDMSIICEGGQPTQTKSGDFNRDGKTDLAIGASWFNTKQGKVYVAYNDGSFPAYATGSDVILTGEATNNYFGHALASGDLTNDGRTDLVVGAYGWNGNKGRAYIYSFNDTKVTGEATNDRFGYSLASGDFNADGRDDLAAGAWGYSSSKGKVYLFYNDGMVNPNANNADATITGEANGNYFGYSLAKGDLNADGRDDLAIGAYYYNNDGKVYIFYNDGSYPSLAGNADQSITSSGADFGKFIHSKDINGDGKDDLLFKGSDSIDYYSKLYIFNNLGTGIYGDTPNTANLIIIDNEELDVGSGNFGKFIAVGDFDNNGKQDFASADSLFDPYGRIYIFYNDGSFATSTSNADYKITGIQGNDLSNVAGGDMNSDGKQDLVAGGTTNTYIFYNDGYWPATSTNADIVIQANGMPSTVDINNDGKADLIIQNIGYSGNAGRTYVYYQDGSWPLTAGGADLTYTGEAANNYFGASLATGDFNTDGIIDLAIGAYGYNSNQGKVYIIPTEVKAAEKVHAKIRGDAKIRGSFKTR